MTLKALGYIDLPANLKNGGFDHAAVDRATAQLYVAHTANDSLDVIDCVKDQYVRSIPNLPGETVTLLGHDLSLGCEWW